MSANEVYSFIGCKVDGGFVPAHSSSVDPGIDEFMQGAGTDNYPTYVAMGTMKPVVTFDSYAIAVALGQCGLDGLAMGAADLIMYWAKRSEVGFVAGACKTLTANKGVLMPERIGGSNDKPAVASFKALVAYDGTNEPLELASSVAIPTVASLVECFYPSHFKTSVLRQIKSAQYVFNWQTKHDVHSGMPYPELAAIRGGDPVWEMSTEDLAVLADMDDAGGGIPGAAIEDAVLFFRKGDLSTGRVPLATEEHISFTASGFLKPGAISGAWREDSELPFSLRLRKPDGAAVSALNTATAIS